jgi:hypothetical protein
MKIADLLHLKCAFGRHKALILAKNVLYNEKSDEDEKRRHGAAPLLGSLIFRGYTQGTQKRACIPRVSSGRKIASKS